MTTTEQPAAGWWLASDGNWYPPETAADYEPPTPGKKKRRWPGYLLIGCVSLLIVAAITPSKDKDHPKSTTTTSAPATTVAPEPTAAPTTAAPTTAAPTTTTVAVHPVAPIEADTTLQTLGAMWDVLTPSEQKSICDLITTAGTGAAADVIMASEPGLKTFDRESVLMWALTIRQTKC